MFKKKFEFFRLNIQTMERLLEVMLKTQSGKLGKDYYLSSKIPMKMESEKFALNFCLKCFKGHICLNHNKKGWGLKCDSCNFRVTCLEGAARVIFEEGTDGKCPECDSRIINATYKPGDKTPFPGNKSDHSGCILCDTIMRSTVVNFFIAKKKAQKAEEDMTEEERKALEEVRKKKEEKKKRKEEQAAMVSTTTAPSSTIAPTEGKKKKKAPGSKGFNKLTQEEIMNDFIKKQFGGA